jgi:hypothetical protein
MLGLGVTSVHALIKAGELTSYLDGRRRKILVASIRKYAAQRMASNAGGPA